MNNYLLIQFIFTTYVFTGCSDANKKAGTDLLLPLDYAGQVQHKAGFWKQDWAFAFERLVMRYTKITEVLACPGLQLVGEEGKEE